MNNRNTGAIKYTIVIIVFSLFGRKGKEKEHLFYALLHIPFHTPHPQTGRNTAMETVSYGFPATWPLTCPPESPALC